MALHTVISLVTGHNLRFQESGRARTLLPWRKCHRIWCQVRDGELGALSQYIQQKGTGKFLNCDTEWDSQTERERGIPIIWFWHVPKGAGNDTFIGKKTQKEVHRTASPPKGILLRENVKYVHCLTLYNQLSQRHGRWNNSLPFLPHRNSCQADLELSHKFPPLCIFKAYTDHLSIAV